MSFQFKILHRKTRAMAGVAHGRRSEHDVILHPRLSLQSKVHRQPYRQKLHLQPRCTTLSLQKLQHPRQRRQRFAIVALMMMMLLRMYRIKFESLHPRTAPTRMKDRHLNRIPPQCQNQRNLHSRRQLCNRSWFRSRLHSRFLRQLHRLSPRNTLSLSTPTHLSPWKWCRHPQQHRPSSRYPWRSLRAENSQDRQHQ